MRDITILVDTDADTVIDSVEIHDVDSFTQDGLSDGGSITDASPCTWSGAGKRGPHGVESNLVCPDARNPAVTASTVFLAKSGERRGNEKDTNK